MKHLLLLTLMGVFSATTTSFAQLPDGSIAPDWTHTDIDGVTHNLYDLLDEGKMVVIEFSATWCGPCWNYMLSGALETFWDEHGPQGTNTAQVFYFEADQNTDMDDLLGLTNESQGNWVAAIPFPIIDLQWGENTDNDYQVGYYPTLYAVCSDRKIYELGQVPASEWEEFITSCQLDGTVDNVEPAICYGDGSVSLDVSGGIAPITYNWSDGSHGATLQNVGAGTYSVTIEESNGKDFIIDNIVITGADAPIGLADSEIESVLCHASSTGSISVELEEGVLPYSYQWSNGAQTQNISNIPAGSYTLNASDNNGCPFEQTFIVNQPTEIAAEYETSADYCDQSNGIVILDIEGGVGGYQVSASEGNVVGHQVINVPAGFVFVEIEDNNGCIWSENIEVDYVPPHGVFFTPNPIITCSQPSTIVTGFVQNGSGDYTYQWATTNGHIVGATNQPMIVADQAGDYSCAIYDIGTGCEVSEEVAVASTISPPPVEAGINIPVSCENLQPVLQGSGDANLIIIWSSPDGNIVSGGDTYNPTINAPGTYIIHVTNPLNSCVNTDTVAVSNEMQPAVAAFEYQSNELTFLGNDASTGSSLTGWSWDFGDGNTSNEQNPIHTYAVEGIFQICLNVSNGCGVSESCQQVEVTSAGSVLLVLSEIHHVLCHGDSTGSISIQVNGGSGIYTYAWTGPEDVTYDTPLIEGIIVGTYQLVVSDDQGNIYIGSFTVTQPDPLVLEGSTVIDNLCFGQTDGFISIDVSGGVGPFSYSFNGSPSQIENSVSNLPGGIIVCEITDANGCTFIAGPYSIHEPEQIEATTIEVIDATGAQQDNGSITVEVTGGTQPYNITWSNGANGTSIQGLVPGEYTYSITDANGCTIGTSLPIVINGIVSTVDTDWSAFISVAPNPSKGNVIVKWDNLQFERGTINLISLEGRHISSSDLFAGTGIWDLSALRLSQGVYVILFDIDGQAVPFKLVVL